MTVAYGTQREKRVQCPLGNDGATWAASILDRGQEPEFRVDSISSSLWLASSKSF